MRIRMIRHAALMLAMAFVAAAVHAQAKIDLNGTWVFTVVTDQASGTATVTLKVEGEKVTGHISNRDVRKRPHGNVEGASARVLLHPRRRRRHLQRNSRKQRCD